MGIVKGGTVKSELTVWAFMLLYRTVQVVCIAFHQGLLTFESTLRANIVKPAFRATH